MQSPPKPATVLGGVPFVLFGCVFIAFALFILRAEARGSEDGTINLVTVGATMLFVAFGLTAVIIGVRTIRRARRSRHVAARYPDQPWMLQADWASGRMYDRSRYNMFFLLVVAAFWNTVSSFALIHFLRNETFSENKGALVILLFFAIGIVVGAIAVYQLLRWRKYGTPVFEMAQVPGVVGGSLGGVVLTRTRVQVQDGFKVLLQCVHRRVTGSGKNRKVQTETLWEREQLRVQPVNSGTGGSAIPVLFTIPYECRPTGAAGPSEDYYWELIVRGQTPGIDYKAVFHVPVYRTKDSSAMVGSALEHLPEEEQAALGLDIRSVQGLRLSQTLSGGERLDFTRHGGRLAFGVLLGMGLGILGMAYLLWQTDIPRLMLWIFICIGAFMLQVSLSALLSSVHLVLHRDRIEIVRRFLGISMSPRVIAREQIQRVEIVQSVKNANNRFYDLVIHTRAGRRVSVPLHIQGQTQAEIVSSYIQRGS